MGKIRVLVASEYQIVRSALRQLLKTDDELDVLLTDTDIGKDLPRTCRSLAPDVLLIEISTSNSSSLRVPANVLTVAPNTRTILLSANENSTYVRAVLATGVRGYVLKSAAQSELFHAVKQVHRGRRFLDARLGNSVPDHLLGSVTDPVGRTGLKQLSRREIEVLRAIALGFTTREISRELDLSVRTIQTYRERIYEKLSLQTRADLVHYALAHGLTGCDDRTR
jgi:two-component system, NarL family, response regulator NreC